MKRNELLHDWTKHPTKQWGNPTSHRISFTSPTNAAARPQPPVITEDSFYIADLSSNLQWEKSAKQVQQLELHEPGIFVIIEKQLPPKKKQEAWILLVFSKHICGTFSQRKACLDLIISMGRPTTPRS